MSWFTVLIFVGIAALTEFSPPVVVALVAVCVGLLVVQRLRGRRELQRRRALVAFAIEVASADVARLQRRIVGERTTVRLLPQQRRPS